MDHYQTIDKILDHIDKNLTQEIRIDTLCQIAHLSKYHFQRLFKSVVGLPAANYIKQRRLAEAALALKQSSRPILEVAIDCGFNSSEVFSRSFINVAGCTPSAYRNGSAILPHFTRPNLLAKRLSIESMGKLYDWQEVELPATNLIGLQGITQPRQRDPKASQIWKTLIASQAQLANIVRPNIHYSLLCGEFAQAPYLFFAGLEVSEFSPSPACFVMRHLPAQRYMRFTHMATSSYGFTDSLDTTLALIYSTWLPQTDGELVDIGIDLIVKTDEASLSDSNRDAVVELYLPIKNKRESIR